jgi:hypothetical protein
MKGTCSNCQFFVCYDSKNEKSNGSCRVSPPSAGEKRWPSVMPNDWCGSYKRDEKFNKTEVVDFPL